MTLLVEWVESGGSLVGKPERQGFGTKPIQRGLAQQLGGGSKLDFAQAGVRRVVTFPITTLAPELGDESEAQKRHAS